MDTCLRIAQADDPILLIEDGVFAVKKGTSMEGRMKETVGRHPVYALQADLKARGIDQVVDGVKLCDYSGFVALVEEHCPHSWL
jgi:tRNA 2-thiouridine synthesizing protein B